MVIKVILFLLGAFVGITSSIAQQLIKATNVRIVTTPGIVLNTSGGIVMAGTTLIKNDGILNILPSTLTKEDWLDSTSMGAMDATSVGVVKFQSDSLQRIYGNTKFYDVIIDNDSGVSLLSNIEVRNVLKLDTGYVATGSNTLLASSTTTNTIQSTSSFTKSWINGRLARITSFAGADYFYPIGKIVGTDTFYAPLFTEKFNGNNATYTAEYFRATPTDFTNYLNPPIARLSQLEYWQIQSSNYAAAADDNARITLSYRGSSVVNSSQAVRDSLLIAQYTNTPRWEATGGGYPAIAINTTSPSFGYIKHSSTVNAFDAAQQNFTLASRSLFNILPYRVVAWNASKSSVNVQLLWNIAFDTDVESYTIEKSIDGVSFQVLVNQLPSQRLPLSYYTQYDYNPNKGWNYYRLKIKAIDGSVQVLPIKKVWFSEGLPKISYYPNPATSIVTLQLPTEFVGAIIQLFDSYGKLVLVQKATAINTQLNIANLANGNYILNVNAQNQTAVLPLSKQ